MQQTELPGIYVDVAELLRGLGRRETVAAIKHAVMLFRTAACDSVHCSEKARHTAESIFLRASGMYVNVPELLHSFGFNQLLTAVREFVDAWPDAQQELVCEISSLIGIHDSKSTDRLPKLHTGSATVSKSRLKTASGGAETSNVVELPRLSHASSASKPPRLPGTKQGGSAASMSSSHSSKTGKVGRGNRATGRCITPEMAAATREAVPLKSAETSTGLLSDSLRQSVLSKDHQEVKRLLAASAQAELTDKDGSCALTLAMKQGIPADIVRTLLESRGSVHVRDGRERALVHLWSWNLPKSTAGMREAQDKLELLVHFKADLDAELHPNSDTALHVLAKVFNALSGTATNVSDSANPTAVLDAKQAAKFAKATQTRIQLLVKNGASMSICNTSGQTPLDLIEHQFQPQLLKMTT